MAKRGCQTPGCRGLGHARGYEQPSHERFADCPYAPQNIANDTLKPDRIKSQRTESRSISTEEFTIITGDDVDNNDPDPEPPSPVGRGNRKRKKRKFFDEVPNKSRQIGGGADANSGGIGNNKISNGFHHVIRHNVFSPDHLAIQSQWEQYWDRNTSFLKPMTQSLNPTIVEKWTPREVARFVVGLPRLSKCDMSFLEVKILEEEVDGEAFLLMTQSDFVKMLGVKLGSAIKIYNALLLIKKSS